MTWSKIASGAAIGALIGGTGALVLGAMESRKASAGDLGVEAEYLQGDFQLCELVSRFKPLATDKELQHLYKRIVTSADGLLKCYVDATTYKSKGSLQFKANRLSYATMQAATQLCKKSFASGNESAADLTREIPNLEGLLNNHLHNLMLT